MKKRYSEEQICLRAEANRERHKGLEVCRKWGLANRRYITGRGSTAYGNDLAEAAEGLEDENKKLRQLVADLSLDKHILQEVVRKKL